jgi:hypothetical protein
MKSTIAFLRLSALTKLRDLKHTIVSHKSTKSTSVFDDIHRNNHWKSPLSASGPGSELAETEEVRALLPGLVAELGIRTLLDVPCGDFSWMKTVELGNIEYLGGDIVASLIESNNNSYGNTQRKFSVLDVVKDPLPIADLIFCRDCLIHLSFKDATAALKNIKTSGAKYLLTTTDPAVRANRPISTGEYRPINLELPPFNMGKPLSIYRDRRRTYEGKQLIDPTKSLALYKLR